MFCDPHYHHCISVETFHLCVWCYFSKSLVSSEYVSFSPDLYMSPPPSTWGREEVMMVLLGCLIAILWSCSNLSVIVSPNGMLSLSWREFTFVNILQRFKSNGWSLLVLPIQTLYYYWSFPPLCCKSAMKLNICIYILANREFITKFSFLLLVKQISSVMGKPPWPPHISFTAFHVNCNLLYLSIHLGRFPQFGG